MATAPAKVPEPPNPEEAKPSVGEGESPGAVQSRRSKMRMRWLIALIALVVVAASVGLYIYLSAWESTDDAQIDGYIYPVSSRVSGYVTRVLVDENQYVQAGTVLVQLDPKDYDVALANAKATLANDQASAAALRTNVPITSVNTTSQLSTAQADLENARAGLLGAQRNFDAAQASLRQAEANDLKAQDDVTRYKPLAAKDEIPQLQYTQAVHTQEATAAAVDTARASAAAAEQAVTQARSRVTQAEAEVQYAATKPQQDAVQRSRAQAADAETERASAVLQQAQLNLQYTTVVAPVSGIVGQRSVQPGQNVVPGQQMMTIVPLDSQNIWVTANFKETQLRKMHPGQRVKISVDTYGRKYDGHVLNIAGASGARYSLLPPENATGNYVKVVQRIPVKIVFEKGQDPEHLLRPGMSVEPKVNVE
jgi:membrane fusion protein (multidrug efflux system)